MKKTLPILLALCLYGFALSAEPITKQQAQQIAAKWFAGKSPAHRAPSAPKMMKTDVVLRAQNNSGNPYLYAVSNGANGYVLVSGDDRAPAVLGYVENGSYNESLLPDNMRSWLQHYIDEIALLQKYNLTSPRKTIADLGEPIAKTTTSRWDQLAPYNGECPLVSTYSDPGYTTERRAPLRAATGCSATALAQVLYMWRDEYAKPEVKEGKLSQDIPARVNVLYQSAEEENKTKIPVWMKFSDEAIPASTTIDWGNLIDEYSERDEEGKIITDESTAKGTPEQQAAVARLMHICGAISEMMYGTRYSGGSGTYSHSGLKGLAMYLNFPNVRYEQQFMYDYEGWVRRLYDELKVAKAVYFGGSSSEGGHAFVIDGYYKEDLFHVNWGWSGLANEDIDNDGYYRINSMLPINQGTGGAVVNDGFRLMQSFYTGLYPNAPASTKPLSVSASMLNTHQTHANVKDGKLELHLTSGASNEAVPVFEAQVALCLESESGYKSIFPLREGLSTMYLSEPLSNDTTVTWTGVTDGDYKVRLYYRMSLDEDVEWALCDRADNSYVSVQVSNGQAQIRNRGSVEVDLLNCDLKEQYTKGEDVAFTLKYKMTKGFLENYVLFSLAYPVKKNEAGEFVEDKSRKECSAMMPAILNSKEGEEFTVEAVLPANNLEVGYYNLICGGVIGFFPSDVTFEVVESGDTRIGLPVLTEDGAARQGNTVWYDLQGRKYGAKPAEAGIYIVGGNKVVVK